MSALADFILEKHLPTKIKQQQQCLKNVGLGTKGLHFGVLFFASEAKQTPPQLL